MPTCSFQIASIACERRQNRRTGAWFKVWTIERVPDDALSVQDSLAGYETPNPWIASICEHALAEGRAIEVTWRDGIWLRVITQIRELEKERVA